MGCDRISNIDGLEDAGFNPRTHMGCDLLLLLIATLIFRFNPRTHMGCDFVMMVQLLMILSFQSTHPHGVRQRSERIICVSGKVSIHAPTWGATRDLTPLVLYRGVSIHAPTWGATPTGVKKLPRSEVSIHAPTWGATFAEEFTLFSRMFQSTHPHGVRHVRQRKYNILLWFQSTHPHGVRR